MPGEVCTVVPASGSRGSPICKALPALPMLNSPILVRTDYTSEDAWQQVSNEAAAGE